MARLPSRRDRSGRERITLNDAPTGHPSQVHWTVHTLGIAGMLAALISMRSLLSSDPVPLDLALFDLTAGLGELGIAAYLALRAKR